jgi:hypothetical protein
MSIPAGRPGRRYASGPDCEESGNSAFGKNGLNLLWNSRFLPRLKKCGTDMKRFHIFQFAMLIETTDSLHLFTILLPSSPFLMLQTDQAESPLISIQPTLYSSCFVPITTKNGAAINKPRSYSFREHR